MPDDDLVEIRCDFFLFAGDGWGIGFGLRLRLYKHVSTYSIMDEDNRTDDDDLACAVCSSELCDEDMRVSLCNDWLCGKCARLLESCPICGKKFYRKHRRLSIWEEGVNEL